MSKKILLSVMAAGCLSRFRNGMQFTKTPKEIEVTQSELATLEADTYLKVKVLSDDVNKHDDDSSDGLAVDTSTKADAADETVKDSETHTDGAKSADVSDKAVDNLAIIVEAMRSLNLDMTADKPTVKELKDQGLDVSAKERDAAWDVLAAEYTESIPE